MPNLLAIWDWKFNNIFVKPASSGTTWRDDATPGEVKAYIRAVLAEKDRQHRQEIKGLLTLFIYANAFAIN